ncbi:hypothetical protein [Streptomyces chromofuscus]|uniref:Uncharacterized protein n=1 Tax=Streptomyces chromofuscus TaxID=42881 RepID=A0A7M2T1W3_STRCW|nr:hypothetical protein [Streptomyces chromofuscus]QOV42660.1 hypothetical protein IPT68_22970 [Streptomyces chromofuscus]GGS89750.1 hypothetical protein GCM10010254_06950 [Streptomyces chromofuscus]
MATSKALTYLESRKNLTGCACGILGLVLTFTGVAGPYWPVVVAGLYGAGALIAPPERPAPPRFPSPSEQLDEVRGDLATLRGYLGEAELPHFAGEWLERLTELLTALLDPERGAPLLAQDPEGVHVLSRAVRQDMPESVDSYVRTRWWTRLTPGQESPEVQLERQLSLLHEELTRVAAGLGEIEVRRQESHTRYLQDRGETRQGPPVRGN